MPAGVVIGACSAALAAIVTEVYAHRCLAHGAFRTRPALAAVLHTYFRVVVWTEPESWAAVHRIHHRYADTPRDPHSPIVRSPAAVLFGSPYLFAVARKLLPADPSPARWIVVLRVAVPAFFLVVLGPAQFLIAAAVHLVLYLGIMGMVNTVGHIHGRKPHPAFSGYDAAWLAIPLLGHGYHNSHHAHPGAARTGRLDPIWPLLRVLAAARLIDLPTTPTTAADRRCCAASTPGPTSLAPLSPS